MDTATSSHAQPARLTDKLFQPVDIASLVFFRIVFGLAIVVEVFRYFMHDWIAFHWTDRPFLFKYYGFEWVQPLPETSMYVFMALVGVMGACIALGLFYRVASIAFVISFTYIFLLEQASYLNHFYLIILLGGMLCLIPAHACFSLDVRRRPQLLRQTVPLWCLLLPAAQLAIAYIYGGIAKLDSDWLQGEPMRIWLWENADFPLVGQYFTWEFMPYAFAWGGLLLDLLLVPALLWKPTRAIAFTIGVMFHVMNSQLFPIGIFPWLMIGATTIFLPPSWPRQLLQRMGWHVQQEPPTEVRDTKQASPGWQMAIVCLLAIHFTVQLTVPFRHFLYPGNASWTEEGHRFAWRMKLRDKEKNRITFLVRETKSGKEFKVDPAYFRLTSHQLNRMGSHPDMILQFAHYLEQEFSRGGEKEVEIYALSSASLNGRQTQNLIDPKVNLAEQPRNLWPAPWIAKLKQPLPPHEQRYRADVAKSHSPAADRGE